jgi:putative tricarboxylic transport membrane protein
VIRSVEGPLRTLLALSAAAALAPVSVLAQQSWKPTRPVMLIAPNAPGGTSDRTARDIQRLFQKHKLVDVPVNVVNRPGGSGTIALNHLHSHPGDPHVLLISTSTTITNHLTGLATYSYRDFTPLAMLLADNYGVNVAAGSAIQSARDLLDRLVKAPDAVPFGVSGAGGSNYTSLMAALKRGGVDFKRVKIATFAGGGQTTMALLGGHVGAINTGLSNMVDHLRQGKMRTLAITGPRRMGAPFADVPTWKEVGVDVIVVGWRGIMGTKGISPAQIAYWEGVLRKMVQTEDWKADLQENFWENIYSGPAETRRKMDAEQVELKQILTELGMTR